MIRSFILLFLLFSIALRIQAQDANSFFDKAVEFFNAENYEDAKKTILNAETLARKENWKGEDAVLLQVWKARIFIKIDRGEAEVIFFKALEICDSLLGKNHNYYGILLNNLGALYETMDKYEKAIPLYLEVLENTEKNFGKNYFQYRVGLNNLAVLYESMGLYEKALPFYLKALENVETNLGKTHASYGNCLDNLAGLYKTMGLYEKALPLYLEALECTEKSLGKKDIEFGFRLNNLAGWYKTMGQNEKALPLYLEALEITKTNLGNTHPDYGILLNNLAGFYKTSGNFEKAFPLYLEALKITEINLGKNHSSYGIRLKNLAGLFESSGDYEKALPLYLEAFEIIEKSLGKNHREYGVCLNNLAELYRITGNYEKALPLYLEALENTEKSLGKNHSDYGIGLNNLGEIYRILGQKEKALGFFSEALKITEKSLGKNHSEYGIRLYNMAGVYTDLGLYEKAIPVFLEALENTEKSLGKNHSYYGTVLNGLAVLYKLMGQYAKATPLFLEVLENTRKTLGKEHSNYGIYLNNMAELYRSLGQFEKALPLYLEALENTEKSLGKNHSDYGIRLNNLAGLYVSMGQFGKAGSLFQLGIEAEKRNLIGNLLGLSEENKTNLIGKSIFINEILQSSMVLQPDSVKNSSGVWENVSFYKGLGLKSTNLLTQKLRESKDTQIVASLEKLTLYQNLVNIELQKPLENQSPQLIGYQKQSQETEAKLLSKSSDFSELKQSLSINFSEFQKVLKPGEAAIEFTHFNFKNKEWTDTVLYAAYIIKPGQKEPEFTVLFREDELTALMQNGSEGKINYINRGIKIKNKNLPQSNYYSLVWEKLEPFLMGIKTLYISPSGLLSKVSFTAMQDTSGKYLGDKYQINYRLSLTDLLFQKEDVKPNYFLFAGGIKFDGIASKSFVSDSSNQNLFVSRSLRGNSWTYLPGTLEEVKNINSSVKNTGKSSTLLTGENGSEENIKKALKTNPSVFHIATHGFYVPFNSEKVDKENANKYNIQEDPMYRSGLILAGGNTTWKNGANHSDKEDGILTAKEVSTMNLSKTQLVVLSACETGLGDLNGSEGVMGLQRALKMAGVGAQITTLWQVPDKETVEFMESFYGLWLKGNALEKAFNTAQTQMSKKYPANPEKWGAFVLYR